MERYFVVRFSRQEAALDARDDDDLETLLNQRWWTVAELRSNREPVMPARLAQFLPAVLAGQAFASPTDITERELVWR